MVVVYRRAGWLIIDIIITLYSASVYLTAAVQSTCTSYCLHVYPSVYPSHAGIASIRRKLGSQIFTN